MPLMGSLHIGASGLQTNQNSLNTTAHNLSNIDTDGYTRQQVQQADKVYITIQKTPDAISNKQVGLGVSYSNVKRVRDFFLDKAYRRESGRSAFYQVSTEMLEEVENQLGEMNGEAFQTKLSDLWTAVQELSKDPASAVTQSLLVQRAGEFVARAQAVYKGLSDYQDNINYQVKQRVDEINAIGEEVLTLNDKIRNIECGGFEHANDLRDRRDSLVDRLGELVSISVKEDQLGDIAIQIEGVDFVKGSTCYQIGLYTDATNGFYTPYWPQDASYIVLDTGEKQYNISGAEVFDLISEISTERQTDIGGLKSLLLARGNRRADYTDMAEDRYDDISQSIFMNVQAEFDQLIKNIATTVNDILAEASGVTKGNIDIYDQYGNFVETRSDAKYCISNPNGYMRESDGSPLQLFNKVSSKNYEKVYTRDASGSFVEAYVYVDDVPELPSTLYTTTNLAVNPTLTQNPSKLSFRLSDGSEDIVTANKLKEAFTAEEYTLNPNVLKKVSFTDYYGDLVSQISNSGDVYKSIYKNQEATVSSVLNAREQIVGVSSDEELSNMIRFQNAYNAASRYINSVSDMLAHIINTLAV